jgi:hypothetical protein
VAQRVIEPPRALARVPETECMYACYCERFFEATAAPRLLQQAIHVSRQKCGLQKGVDFGLSTEHKQKKIQGV